MPRSLSSVIDVIKSHRGVGLDLLRMYLGVGLFVRGVLFVSQPQLILDLLDRSGDWFWPFALVHYVAIAHICGGLMLATGVLTRVAALLQLPPVIGATFVVHLHDGLFARGQSLELAALVMVMLFVFAIFGGGRLSVDGFLRTRSPTTGRGPMGRIHPA